MNWEDRANCRDANPKLFYAVGDSTATNQHNNEVIRTYCTPCPVRTQCLQNADEHGIWGGLTEKERRKIKRHNTADRTTHNGRRIVDVELPPGKLKDGQFIDSTDTLQLLAEAHTTMPLPRMAMTTGVEYETLRKLMNRNGGKVTVGVARRIHARFANEEATA